MPDSGQRRSLRYRAHIVFDRFWRRAKTPNSMRNIAYRWLAHQLGISRYECHFSKLNSTQCRIALDLFRNHATYRKLVEWNKGNQNIKKIKKAVHK